MDFKEKKTNFDMLFFEMEHPVIALLCDVVWYIGLSAIAAFLVCTLAGIPFQWAYAPIPYVCRTYLSLTWKGN